MLQCRDSIPNALLKGCANYINTCREEKVTKLFSPLANFKSEGIEHLFAKSLALTYVVMSCFLATNLVKSTTNLVQSNPI